MEHTLTSRAITKECKAHIIRAEVFFSKCQSCPGTDLRTHDAMTAEEILRFVKDVHGPAFTLGDAGLFAK